MTETEIKPEAKQDIRELQTQVRYRMEDLKVQLFKKYPMYSEEDRELLLLTLVAKYFNKDL